MNNYILNPNGIRYYVLNVINEGGFGIVYSGLTQSRSGVAIKIIRPTPHFKEEWSSWLNEVNIFLKCFYHPHIVKVLDFFPTKDTRLAIIMEKAICSLHDLIEAKYKLNIRQICIIGLQISDALRYIHKQNIIHRDITPKNILIFPNGIYKLSDFGIAKRSITSEELARTLIGYRSYVPPELLWYGYSSKQSDIYQLGLVLFTLMTGEAPIPSNLSNNDINNLIAMGIPRQKAESLIGTKGLRGKLAKIISIMLRRRDKYRYKDASGVYKDLFKIVKLYDKIIVLLASIKKYLAK